jgi:hypothetical protein
VNWVGHDAPIQLRKAGNEIKQHSLESLTDIVQSARASILDRLARQPDDIELQRQAFVLDELLQGQLQTAIEGLHKLHLLTPSEHKKLLAVNESSVEKQLQADQEARVLAERRAVIDEIIGQLAEIHKPYVYTAKRIRSFEDGPGLIRELQEELLEKRLLSDDYTIQQLAVLVLQNDQAKDKVQYFSTIEEKRISIRDLLQQLAAAGAEDEFRSDLTNVLNWLDEIIDAGTDAVIKHPRLSQFIFDYCIGPEISEIEASEDLTTQKDDEKAALQHERRLSIEAYTAALAEILQTVDIQYADVDVFPPGNGDAPQAKSTERNIGALTDIDPRRLINLISLKSALEGQGNNVELFFTNSTSWSPVPPFVLFASRRGAQEQGVCLIEHPVNGHASYAAAVDGVLIKNWQELVTAHRNVAVEFGAKAFVHPPKGSAGFDQHYSLRLQPHLMLLLNNFKSNP